MDLQLGLLLASVILSGVNLAFVLKIILNDLHELRTLFVRHLEDHAKSRGSSN